VRSCYICKVAGTEAGLCKYTLCAGASRSGKSKTSTYRGLKKPSIIAGYQRTLEIESNKNKQRPEYTLPTARNRYHGGHEQPSQYWCSTTSAACFASGLESGPALVASGTQCVNGSLTTRMWMVIVAVLPHSAMVKMTVGDAVLGFHWKNGQPLSWQNANVHDRDLHLSFHGHQAWRHRVPRAWPPSRGT